MPRAKHFGVVVVNHGSLVLRTAARVAVLFCILAPADWVLAQPESVGESQLATATEQLTPPVLLEQMPVSIPRDTVFLSPEVVVLLELLLNEQGEVSEAKLLEKVGEPFDAAALVAAAHFQFAPARLSTGEPTAVKIHFRLVIEKPAPLPPKPVQFTGLLLERGTRKPLAGVSLAVRYNGKTQMESTTNAKGEFSLNVRNPSFTLVGVSFGHERLEVTIDAVPGEQRSETFYLQAMGGRFEEVIHGRRLKREVTRRVIPRDEILLVAGTQGDAIKVVENLPGANRSPSAGRGAGHIILRGANPGDSLVMLEGFEIPLIYHFGSLRSSFNSGFLESVEFVPGNFSADYGRATGGMVQVRVRKLASTRFRGTADFNLYDAGVLLEGPLGDGWTGGFAFHRSYIDAILPALIPEDAPLSFNTAPRYYDYQMIVEKDFAEAGEFRAMFYGSQDSMRVLLEDPNAEPLIRGAMNARTMFHNIQLHYESNLAPWLQQSTAVQLGVVELDFSMGEDLYFKSLATPLELRSTWRFESTESLSFRAGFDLRLMPGEINLNLPRPSQEGDNPVPLSTREFRAISESFAPFAPGIFLEMQYEPIAGLTLMPGVRVDHLSDIGTTTIDPRLFVRWVLSTSTLLSAAIGHYQQPPDPWESDPSYGNPNLGTEKSLHASLGLEQALPWDTTFELTGYYKAVNNIVVAASQETGDSAQERYTNSGEGRIFGAELLLRFAPVANIRGWVAYTFQRSFRRDSAQEDERLFDFDQPHIFTLVASWKLGSGWTLGTRFRLVSGNPWTPVEYAIYDSDQDVFVPVYAENNSDRLAPFVQWDIRIDKAWTYDTWKLTLYLDVQNVTNHANQEGWRYNFDFSERSPLTSLPILPILGLKGEW